MSLCKGIDTEDSNSTYIAIRELYYPIILRVEAAFFRRGLVEIVWRTRDRHAKSKTVR